MKKRYSGRVYGFPVEADETAPPSGWRTVLARFFLNLLGYRNVTVYRVPTEVDSYRIGIIEKDGAAWCDSTEYTSRYFGVIRRHEPCKVFAILRDGTELPLQFQSRTRLDDVPSSIPLI